MSGNRYVKSEEGANLPPARMERVAVVIQISADLAYIANR